jgi:hypothetical protein
MKADFQGRKMSATVSSASLNLFYQIQGSSLRKNSLDRRMVSIEQLRDFLE